MRFYKPFWIAWFPLFLLMLAIFLASTWPIPPLPKYYHSQDKIAHIVMYLILSVVMLRAYLISYGRSRATQWMLMTIILATLYGFFIEICQIYCNRYFELGDIISNGVGAILGAMLARFFGHKLIWQFA